MERIYLETSIISYLTSMPSRDLIIAARQQVTVTWWATRRTSYELYISPFVVREIRLGDPDAAQRRVGVVLGIPELEPREDVLDLARQLISEGAVPLKASEDALHIAIAAVHGMDYLMTWNFRHIANAVMRSSIDGVCLAHGVEPPIICTPEELMGE